MIGTCKLVDQDLPHVLARALARVLSSCIVSWYGFEQKCILDVQSATSVNCSKVRSKGLSKWF